MFTFPVYIEAEGKACQSPLDRHLARETKKRELAEQDRWLYVALTRAKKSLCLSWSDERYENHSWAAKARLHAADRFSRNPDYEIEIKRPPFSEIASHSPEITSGNVRGKWASTEDLELESRAVTDLADSPFKLTVQSLLHRQKRASFGLQMHRAFEMLKTRVEFETVQQNYPELEEALDYVWNLDSPPLRHLIQTGSVEWGFKIKTAASVVQGRIDLWGKGPDGRIWIVDYKSGRSREDEVYWNQLQVYAWALRQFGNEGPIELALVHPLDRKVLVQSFTDEDFFRISTDFANRD